MKVGKALNYEGVEQAFMAHFLMPLDDAFDMRVILNPRSLYYRLVFDGQGYWLYDLEHWHHLRGSPVTFRPNDDSKRELMFTTRTEGRASETAFLGHLPGAARLVMITREMNLRSMSLVQIHGLIGHAPSLIRYAPERVQSVVQTFTQLRSLVGGETPLGLLPNELLFQIFSFL
jgi:hypothetical protein